MRASRLVRYALLVLGIALVLTSCGGAGDAAKLESLIRAHPLAFVPEVRGALVGDIGNPARARVKCSRRGYLAGVGADYSCDVLFSRRGDIGLCRPVPGCPDHVP